MSKVVGASSTKKIRGNTKVNSTLRYVVMIIVVIKSNKMLFYAFCQHWHYITFLVLINL